MAEQGQGVAQDRHAGDLGRIAAQAVIEHAKHGQLARGAGLFDHTAGVFGGADHDDVGGQPSTGAPLAKHAPPKGLGAGHSDGAEREPQIGGHDVSLWRTNERNQRQGGGGAGQEGGGDAREGRAQAFVLFEAIGAHQAQGPQQQGRARRDGQD